MDISENYLGSFCLPYVRRLPCSCFSYVSAVKRKIPNSLIYELINFQDFHENENIDFCSVYIEKSIIS